MVDFLTCRTNFIIFIFLFFFKFIRISEISFAIAFFIFDNLVHLSLNILPELHKSNLFQTVFMQVICEKLIVAVNSLQLFKY